jgi:hypothetical protein
MDILKAAQLSDPNGFFETVNKKDYKDYVVIAPSMLPPSLLSATIPPTEYWKRMARSIGYLKGTGFGGTKFPIVVRGAACWRRCGGGCCGA